jgi:hypothetical protein
MRRRIHVAAFRFPQIHRPQRAIPRLSDHATGI